MYLSGSDVNNKAPQQWYSTESLMMSAVNGTTVSHIAVLDAGVTDIDVGFHLVMSQGCRSDHWRRVWERGQIVADVTLYVSLSCVRRQT